MAAHQAPPSLGFSRQEHWNGLPFPSPMHESEKWKWSRSVVSDSYRPTRLGVYQATRLLCPWDFPGKSIGVGCHCLLHQNLGHSIFEGHIQPNESVMLSSTCKKLLNCHGRLQEMGLSWVSTFYSSTALIHCKDWCWSPNTLATWCEEPTHWKRPCCWERLKTGEGDDRGWDGWMTSLTQWTWVWANSRR